MTVYGTALLTWIKQYWWLGVVAAPFVLAAVMAVGYFWEKRKLLPRVGLNIDKYVEDLERLSNDIGDLASEHIFRPPTDPEFTTTDAWQTANLKIRAEMKRKYAAKYAGKVLQALYVGTQMGILTKNDVWRAGQFEHVAEPMAVVGVLQKLIAAFKYGKLEPIHESSRSSKKEAAG